MSEGPLWAPWRMAYIRDPDTVSKSVAKTENQCFLCDYAASSDDRTNFVVWRNELAFVALNRFPYNNGHLLVSPIEHKSCLTELTTEEHLACMEMLNRMIQIIQEEMQADGFNVGLNLGKAAGAGVPGHLHWHLVPRWQGDQNFMPVVAGTHVIPEALESLYDLLIQRLAE